MRAEALRADQGRSLPRSGHGQIVRVTETNVSEHFECRFQRNTAPAARLSGRHLMRGRTRLPKSLQRLSPLHLRLRDMARLDVAVTPDEFRDAGDL